MDTSIFESINHFAARSGWAQTAMRVYAEDGIVLFALLLLAAYLRSRHRGDLGGVAGSVSAGVAALVALGVGQVVGSVVARPRPYDAMPRVLLLVSRTADVSFPSDHATAVGAVAAGLWFVDRRLGIGAGIAAVVMAFARVYVGAHYPGDVVAGLALGAVVAATLHLVLVPRLTRLARRLAGVASMSWAVTASS